MPPFTAESAKGASISRERRTMAIEVQSLVLGVDCQDVLVTPRLAANQGQGLC